MLCSTVVYYVRFRVLVGEVALNVLDYAKYPRVADSQHGFRFRFVALPATLIELLSKLWEQRNAGLPSRA